MDLPLVEIKLSLLSKDVLLNVSTRTSSIVVPIFFTNLLSKTTFTRAFQKGSGTARDGTAQYQ